MRRFAWILAVVAMLAFGWGVAAQEGFTISGRIGATEQESQEGYFAVDQETMIVVKPGSELHKYLKGKVGHRVRVTIEPEPDSE